MDDVLADPLVMAVVHGDRAAWFQLSIVVEAWVERELPRHFRLRRARLHGTEDDLRDVLVDMLARMERDNFRLLHQYLEHKCSAVPDVRSEDGVGEQTSFAAFVARLADYAVREHVRRRYGRPPTEEAKRAAAVTGSKLISKRQLHSWAEHAHAARSDEFGSTHPALSRVLTAQSILRHAAETFDPREMRLFGRYLEQCTFEELADEFELEGPESARAEVRKLKERLRKCFRGADVG